MGRALREGVRCLSPLREGEAPCARVGLAAFTTAWVEHMDALPKPRPYAAALGWLRREMGEVDLGAVEAMKAPQHDQSALAGISLPMRPPIAAEPPPLALGTLWAHSGHPMGTLWAPSGHPLGTWLCQHSTPLVHC